jgi:tetratricopeptide (TPR) repeat protein
MIGVMKNTFNPWLLTVRRCFHRGVAVFGLASAPLWVLANTPQNITAGEVARLPEYCANAQSFARQGIPDAPSAIQRHWLGLMGTTFWHMHHYCWALVSANRSEDGGLAPNQRVYLLNSAISDANYVLERAPPDFPLLPEIFYRVGQYHLKAGRPVESMSHFNKSRTTKPDYWPPYIELAKISAALGKQQEAVAVLEEGLKLMPDQPQLTEALKRVKQSRPAPTVTKKPKTPAQP